MSTRTSMRISQHMTGDDTVPLTDLEAAHIPDNSSIHSLSRPPSPIESRPPSYPARAAAYAARPFSYSARPANPFQSRSPSYPARPASYPVRGTSTSAGPASNPERPISYPARPPSYSEQGTEEPLPTYMDVVKRKTIALQQYPASKVPNRRARICLVSGFALLCVIILAVSIAVTRVNGNNAYDNNIQNANGAPV